MQDIYIWQWLTGWRQGQLGVSLGVHRSGHGGRVPGHRDGLRQADQTLDGAVHGSSGVRSRSAAIGRPPACGHHSQRKRSLQRLAHSTLPSSVGGLPGQPPVTPAIRPGGTAHGRARTPISHAAGTVCPQHALGSASALHALPRRRHHHPCSLTGRRSSHTGGQHQPPLSDDWSQDADSQVHRHGHRLPTAPYRP